MGRFRNSLTTGMAGWTASFLAAAISAWAQAPEHVIRIDVNLVQVDAVVTDSKGRPVTDLQAGDFEILQDGKRQAISNFSYVTSGQTAPAAAPAGTKGRPMPPVKLKPEDVRRTIALVVDDLGLSFEGTAYVRQALKKFVDDQMQPGDLVAIVRTGAGIGALQQFTSDKRMLYAAIDRVRYNAMGRIGISRFAPAGDTDDPSSAEIERNSIFTVGTLGAARYIIDGLQELPGRKAILLFSEDLKLLRNDSDRAMQAVRALVDAANRASVVIYTIDPGGLRVHGPSAADKGIPPPDLSSRRSQEEFESREGLVLLAHDTGGQFFSNTNDVDGTVRDIVKDTESYYLIAYHPAAGTFEEGSRKKAEVDFHRIQVRVKRPGLQVRSRSGFFGTPDRRAAPAPRTRQGQIAKAISSPFGANGLEVRLTPLYTQGAQSAYLNTLLYIGGKDLTFTDEADGWKKAVIDVVTMTFGDNGQAVDSKDMTYTIRMKPEIYVQAQKGLLYSVKHPVGKPGAYQMRVVVRDTVSEKVGAASQFIEVPDVGKGRLTLSSIMMQQERPEAPPAGAEPQEGQVATADIQASAAVRSFLQGTAVLYGYEVLNAKSDTAPRLESQIRLFRNGKQVYQGQPLKLSFEGQKDPKRLLAGGHLKLGGAIAKGEYVLEVTVTDQLAKESRRSATQWIDFEIR